MKKLRLFILAILFLIPFLTKAAIVITINNPKVGFYGPAPVITSFTPSSGAIGTLVTIDGNNLNTPTTFTIGGIPALVISNTGTQLVGMVMPGAVTGSLSVTTSSGTTTGGSNFTVIATPYPTAQQGNKLVGTGNTGKASIGYAVAVSADGNTAIVGGVQDNNYIGAAWIYTRTGAIWAQQTILVGSGAVGASWQGSSVAISADGNTAVVGGRNDNGNIGAAWVYTRSNGIWTQQGSKLVGSGYTGSPHQAGSVALSADGNTVVIGGSSDSPYGAIWVFTRTNGIWNQQGAKITDTSHGNLALGASVGISADASTIAAGTPNYSNNGGAFVYVANSGTWALQAIVTGPSVSLPGDSQQGISIALSADGNTLIEGSTQENYTSGGAWVFTRAAGVWTLQGSKLDPPFVGINPYYKGKTVSLTADGNIATLSSQMENGGQGAVWVYKRSGSNWVYQNTKLVGIGNTGAAAQGTAAAISADGSTIISGGMNDNSSQGAVWVFAVGPPVPIVASFTPTTAITGTTVTIIGANFTGATGVSFGGVAAASYTVNSPTNITAVAGGASASGAVSVTTAYGTTSLAGLTFIPAPIITSFTPTNSIPATVVTITGANFTNASAVSFGGSAAASFKVNSATSITAVVKYGATGNVAVTTPGGTASLAGFNYAFTLPPTNFNITATSAACKGSSNGFIKIIAALRLNYTATVTVNSITTPYNFTDSLTIPNLSAGTYHICFTVAGQNPDLQCFDVVVAEPKDLSVYVASIGIGNKVVVTLNGGINYNVNLNGTVITTSSSQLTLSLTKGANTILVSTDRACQGVVEKDINITEEAIIYPNPFDDMLHLNIGSSIVKKLDINIYSLDGKVVYTTKYNNASGVLQLELSKLNSGLYVLRLTADESEIVFKIIKK